MRFPASYDTTTKIVSAAVCALLITLIVVIHNIYIALFGIALVALAYAWSPRAYTIDAGTLTIHRLIGNQRLALSAITAVRPGTSADFTRCFRLWGSGGMFGYYGLFSTSRLGQSTWYVTNRRNTVILETSGKPIVLSPDDRDRFLQALGPRTAAEPALAAPGFSSSAPRVGAILGVALGLAIIAFLIYTFSYSPGPPNVTFTPDTLTIHDRFYSVTLHKSDIDLPNVRVIDLNAEPGWRPTARTNGFANGHYRSGWFRVANGQKVRLYSAGANRLVLIPPKGDAAAVLLEAADPDAFTARLRSEFQSHN